MSVCKIFLFYQISLIHLFLNHWNTRKCKYYKIVAKASHDALQWMIQGEIVIRKNPGVTLSWPSLRPGLLVDGLIGWVVGVNCMQSSIGTKACLIRNWLQKFIWFPLENCSESVDKSPYVWLSVQKHWFHYTYELCLSILIAPLLFNRGIFNH